MFSFCLCKQRICRCLMWADILPQPRFLFFSSSIWSDTAFLFLSDCSGSAFFFDSSRYKLYFCLALLATRSNSTGYINLVNATNIPLMIADNSLGNKGLSLQMNFFSLLVYWSLFLQLLDRVKEQATFWQRSTTCSSLCQTWSHASRWCVRPCTLDLTGSKFTKRFCSFSIMEAVVHTRSAGAEFHPHHFQLLCYTALTGAIQTSDMSCSCLCRI